MRIRPDRMLLWICALALAAAVMVWVTVSVLLPAYLESGMIPQLAGRMNLEARQVHVRRIDWWGADLGPIELQSRGMPVLTLAAVQIDYTPLDLLHRRISAITLAGLSLAVEITGEGISVPGFKPGAAAPSPAPDFVLPDFETLLPVRLKRLEVTQSQIVLNHDGRRYTVPLDIRLQTDRLNRGELQGRIRLSILDNPMVLTAVVNQHANSAQVTVESDGFELGCLSQAVGLPEGFGAAGGVRLEGRGTLRLMPFALSGLDLTASLADTRINLGGALIENVVEAQNAPQPIALSLTAANGDHIQVAGGPFRLSGPAAVVVTTLTGHVKKEGTGWSLDAQADTVLPVQPLAGGLSLEASLPMGWTLEAGGTAENTIHFKVHSAGTHPVATQVALLKFNQQNYAIDVEGHYDARGLEAQGRLSADGLRLSMPDGEVTASGVRIGGTLSVPPEGAQDPPRFEAQASLIDMRARQGNTLVRLPKIESNAHGRDLRASGPVVEGRLKISEGNIHDKPHGLAMTGLTADLPWRWPAVDQAPAGRLDLQTVQWNGRSLGGVKGIVRQNARRLELDLEHRSRLLSGLIVLLKGHLEQTGLHADVRVPAYQPSRPVDLGLFVPAAAGFSAGGRLEAQATVDIANGGPSARADLKISQGTLTQDEDKLELDGIEMDLRIDDPVAFKSAPKQKLRVENLKLGKLAAHKLDVDFQLEDSRTLFVEKAGVQWCGGRINTAALRVIEGKEDYDITLFCDRLNLSGVLEQLGAAEASGEGTVNGRIPVRWAHGRLSFDNGFLYSTPGQPGVIKLTGTEVLLAGMPPGSPQHTQLDIATEALKDYTYQWAKLSVQSDRDVLLLKLQLDGKPNRLLPFAYDQSLGQFMRIKGEGQAEFKGISIDLNFKSPLNEIVHYKEFLKRN